MAKAQFKFVLETGQVEIEGVGCSGPQCKTLTAPIEKKLGIAEDVTHLPEFFQEDASAEQKLTTEE